MTKFLAIQNSYHDIQLALFRDSQILDFVRADKIEASRMLLPLLSSLLDKNSLTLSDLKFIAANKGPGPFTTLRTVLASVNGLSFATKIPLIGVDSLDALIYETQLLTSVRSDYVYSGPQARQTTPDKPESTLSVRPACPEVARGEALEGPGSNRPLIVLLNAFNQDVYFAISHGEQKLRGCQKIQPLILELAATITETPHSTGLRTGLHFVGNGAIMHQDLIRATFGERALFDDPIPEGPSIETIGLMALEKWQCQEDLVSQLMPVYLK